MALFLKDDLSRLNASVDSLHQTTQAVLVESRSQRRLLAVILAARIVGIPIEAIPASGLATASLPLLAYQQVEQGLLWLRKSSDGGGGAD